MSVLRILFPVLFCSLLVIDLHPLSADAGKDSGRLEALVAWALENNPEVRASEERWRMRVEQVRQEGTLDDPMMRVGIQNALIRDPFNFSRENMTSKVIGVSQKLPFYGKRDLMRKAAGLEAEAEHWVVAERRIELRRMVKETWYRIYFIDRSLETVADTIRLLDTLTRLAESMYGVGKAEQQEVFQAQLERSKMEKMRIDLQQNRRSLAATLNALAYRPPETVIPPIARVPMTPLILSPGEIEQLALENRPAIKGLHAQIDKADVGSRLAEKEFFPDVTVSLEYMQRDSTANTPGDDMYTAGLSFNLPIQRDRRHAKVAETQAERRMALHQLAALKNQIRQAITDGLAQLERSRKLIGLYDKGILAQANGAVESSMAAYRTDKASFSQVLANRLAVFNFEREYHGAVADYQMQLAVLEGVVGVPIPPKP
jgi:outer membrane protein TolC